MGKKQKDIPANEETVVEEPVETTAQTEAEAEVQTEAQADPQAELLAAAEDKYLRLAAEYDNFRKRTIREKESAWTDSKAQTVAAFLPVYDNLERALKQDTVDEAYKKGVEMTMTGLKDVLTHLGVEFIPAMGETFDPNLHNAVMHVDDDSVETKATTATESRNC